MNVQMLDNGLYAPDGALQYAWFRLFTPQGERFRCIALRQPRLSQRRKRR